MNQTSAINVWRGTNRVSRLWEELLADLVSPDPLVVENTLPAAGLERALLPETLEMDSLAVEGGQSDSAGTGLLEKAGFESLRMIKNALDILSAPSEVDTAEDTGWRQGQESLPDGPLAWERTTVRDLMQAGSMGLTFVKVSSEPEPQPGSSIDTRRIAHGLKIPPRPLHKRSLLQRLYFCLRQMMSRTSNASL